MSDQLPAILDSPGGANFPALIDGESELLAQARKLFDAEFYDHLCLMSGMQPYRISGAGLRHMASIYLSLS